MAGIVSTELKAQKIEQRCPNSLIPSGESVHIQIYSPLSCPQQWRGIVGALKGVGGDAEDKSQEYQEGPPSVRGKLASFKGRWRSLTSGKCWSTGAKTLQL